MQCSSDCMLYLVCIIWDEFTRKVEFILWMLSRVDSFFSETTILWSLLRYTTKGHKFLALWPFQGCKAAQWPWGGAGPIFFKDGYRPQEAMLKIFLEFPQPISDIQTQLAIFRIEYNAYCKAKLGNFLKHLKLNMYLQTIIIGEKNSFWIESNVI